MRANLGKIHTEMLQYLRKENFVVFPTSDDVSHASLTVWDVQADNDWQHFTDSALAIGCRVMRVRTWQMVEDDLDELLDLLTAAGDELPEGELKQFEERIGELRRYQSMIGRVDLSFDHEQRTFRYSLSTEWMEDFFLLLEELTMEADTAGMRQRPPQGPVSGYFNPN
jgi:hypothetical protein